jgi:hypothetical protein
MFNHPISNHHFFKVRIIIKQVICIAQGGQQIRLSVNLPAFQCISGWKK